MAENNDLVLKGGTVVNHDWQTSRDIGVRDGRIAPGYDADLAIVDLKLRQSIEFDWLASKGGWSSFAVRKFSGWPVGTFVRGRKVMRESETGSEINGAAVAFDEALSR